MRVLLVTDWNRGRGGAEATIALIRHGLEAAGDEVRMLTSSVGTAGDGEAEYVAFGSELPAAQAFLQISNPFAVRTLRRAIAEFNPDVALVNMFAHHLSPAILHAMGHVPVILVVSDYKCVCPIGSKLLPDNSICESQYGRVCNAGGCVRALHWIRDIPRYASIRSGVARAKHVLACSEYVKRELQLAGIVSECVYLPVNTPSERYERKRSDEPVILFCGRLDREKGAETLLQAFSILLNRTPSATLRIAGIGPERQRLQSLAKNLRIEHSTTFLGWLEPGAIEAELSSAWALAAPSLWPEPLGLVALEAIMRGVPVVASATGGFAETVEDGLSGTLVANGDVRAVADALGAIVTGESFPNGIPFEVSRRVTVRHDVHRYVERLRSLFADVIRAYLSTGQRRLS